MTHCPEEDTCGPISCLSGEMMYMGYPLMAPVASKNPDKSLPVNPVGFALFASSPQNSYIFLSLKGAVVPGACCREAYRFRWLCKVSRGDCRVQGLGLTCRFMGSHKQDSENL